MTSSTTQGKLVVIDTNTNSVVTTLGRDVGQINGLSVCPTAPVVVTAHEDRYLRFWDMRSDEMIHEMVAHLDSVSCVEFDPTGSMIVSGGTSTLLSVVID